MRAGFSKAVRFTVFHAAVRAGVLFFYLPYGGEVNSPLAPPDFRRKATLSLT